jgi:hypothetical protein
MFGARDEREHDLANDVFAEKARALRGRRRSGRTAWTGALELEISAHAISIDTTQKNGAAVSACTS